MLTSGLAVQGASYYVSPFGSDASAGTQTHPFATIQFAASRLVAGDTLFLHTGDYHETFTLSNSGTATAPITIEALPGAQPTLVGATPVGGPWAVYSGAIYMVPWPNQPTQVFGAGQLLNEARWPNTPIEDFAGMTYAMADSGTQDYITSSALPDVDLTGAWVRVMAGQAWVAYDRQIVSHDRASGTLTFSAPINAMSELIPRRGNHFFVFGKLELLDSPGEWWWDPNQQQLYVWMPDGASPEGRTEAGVAPAVLDLSGQSYVTVKGLSARGGWFNLQNSINCTLQDFHLRAPNWIRTFDGYSVWPQYLGGVDVSGSGNVIDGGTVQNAGRSGIHIAGTGNTVQQVTVQDQGWNWAAEFGINMSGADQSVVQNNTVTRSAMAGIYLAPNSRVLNNLVEDVCLFVEDCGNVDTWNMDGRGTEIAYNIFIGNHARWGGAIYLDAGSLNFRMHDNLARAIAWNGVNITGVNDIENNTFVDIGHQGINYNPGATAVGADWSAGKALHNQLGEPFPLFVELAQPISIIPDYGFYEAYTPLAPQPGPRRVEIDWSQLAQPGWSQQQVPLNLSEVDGILFGFDPTVGSFSYTISNLRLLPAGETGDTGAVPVTGTTWTAISSGGSACTLTASGPLTWGASGSSALNGQNLLNAPLPTGFTNLTAYRGLAFELAGTASRTYSFQGYQDVDNGPDPEPGRGATLPANVGATPPGLSTRCPMWMLSAGAGSPSCACDRDEGGCEVGMLGSAW
jgi:parallel beta-helix repeat protein